MNGVQGAWNLWHKLASQDGHASHSRPRYVMGKNFESDILCQWRIPEFHKRGSSVMGMDEPPSRKRHYPRWKRLIFGDGKKIKFANDAWIYKGSTDRIDHRLSVLVVAEAKVEILLNTMARSWNDNYIWQLVLPDIVDDIMQVDLPDETCDDVLATYPGRDPDGQVGLPSPSTTTPRQESTPHQDWTSSGESLVENVKNNHSTES